MVNSRSERHQQKRRRSSRRMLRLLILNICLLLFIAGAFIIGGGSIGMEGITWPWQQQGQQEQGMSSGDLASSDTDETAEEQAAGAGEIGNTGDPGNNSPSAPGLDPASEGDSGAGVGEPQEQEDQSVLLSFVGDILLASSVERLMEQRGYDYPYARVLSYLSDSDLTAGNLENPITTHEEPQDKQYVFKGSPRVLPALREAGIDIVGLANNHTLDHGVQGLFDTMKHLDEAGIPHVGAGKDDVEAFTPVILEANGIKVAYFSLSRVVPVTEWKADKYQPGVAETYDLTRAIAAIEQAEQEADVTVVMVHWGLERAEYPEDYQRQFARAYIDAGADLVIGAHPHVLQGFEQYEGKWIAYSLGNFIFNMTRTPRTAYTGVLDARCNRDGTCAMRFHPMLAHESQPAPLDGEEALAQLKYLEQLSFDVKIDENGHLNAASSS